MDLTSTVTSRKEAEEQKAEFLEILQQKLKENISTEKSKLQALAPPFTLSSPG